MGKDYSQRTSYNMPTAYDSKKGSDFTYVIFGPRSLKDARNGHVPTGLYVKYKHHIKN